jgi:hypothetical protein
MQMTMRKLNTVWPLVMFFLLPGLARSETAVQAWVQRYNGPGNGDDQPYAMAMDNSNNVIVTGYSIASGGDADYATINYSSAGVPLWTNRYNGPANSDDKATAAAVDNNDSVIVTGYSISSGGNYDYATIKYSSVGVPLWTNRYNAPANSNDVAYVVAVDSSNNVVVTGSSYANIGFGVYSEYATIKYSSAGVPLWTNRYSGSANY